MNALGFYFGYTKTNNNKSDKLGEWGECFWDCGAFFGSWKICLNGIHVLEILVLN
jgi:hypothetical protein